MMLPRRVGRLHEDGKVNPVSLKLLRHAFAHKTCQAALPAIVGKRGLAASPIRTCTLLSHRLTFAQLMNGPLMLEATLALGLTEVSLVPAPLGGTVPPGSTPLVGSSVWPSVSSDDLRRPLPW